MASRRPLVKRLAAWTAAAVLLVSMYLASYPCNLFIAVRHWSRAIPMLQFLYAPLNVYSRNPTYFGSLTYKEYTGWAYSTIFYRLIGDEESSGILDSKTIVQFTGTPLHRVTRFVGEIHNYPIEFDSGVDREVEITVNSKATLREALAELLEPHGLIAWPAKGRIAIGSQAAIERVKAEDRRKTPVPVGAWILLGLFLLSGGTLAALLRHRRVIDPHGRNDA